MIAKARVVVSGIIAGHLEVRLCHDSSKRLVTFEHPKAATFNQHVNHSSFLPDKLIHRTNHFEVRVYHDAEKELYHILNTLWPPTYGISGVTYVTPFRNARLLVVK